MDLKLMSLKSIPPLTSVWSLPNTGFFLTIYKVYNNACWMSFLRAVFSKLLTWSNRRLFFFTAACWGRFNMLCPQITAIPGKGQVAERGLQVRRGKQWVKTRGNQGRWVCNRVQAPTAPAWQASKSRVELLEQRILTLLWKPMDQKEGGLVSQRIVFLR